MAKAAPAATAVRAAGGAYVQIIYPTVFADNNLPAPMPVIAYGIIGTPTDLECDLTELGTPYPYHCSQYISPVGHAWEVIFGNVPDADMYLLVVRPKGAGEMDEGDNVIFQVSGRGRCCCG